MNAVPPADPAQARAWTVSALLLAIADTLSARFAAVTVRGELSGFTRAASGHCYFTLKDADGGTALRCAMFRRAAQWLDFEARDGLQVELRGRLAVYEARGELQLVAEAMRPLGAGGLYEEFLRLKARLQAQGLFDAQRKRALPAYPRCIALVTSAAGAALHDVLTTLARRAPQVAVHLYPSLVQGPGAPGELVAALQAANADEQAELVLLCRGGGSLEDLWAFNDEHVVRAVAASARPLLCGVGHETDITLADLAADLRAPTPTAAAELAAPPREQLAEQLRQQAQRLRQRVAQRLDQQAQRLDALGLRLQRPGQALAVQAARLEPLAQRLRGAVALRHQREADQLQRRGQRLLRAQALHAERQHARLDALAARLAALNPRQVLSRGYAWMATPEGVPVMSARGLQPGQALRAVWHDGEAGVEVRSAPE